MLNNSERVNIIFKIFVLESGYDYESNIISEVFMNNIYEKDYSLITGLKKFGKYTTPEDEGTKIEKCSILKPVNIVFNNKTLGYKK